MVNKNAKVKIFLVVVAIVNAQRARAAPLKPVDDKKVIMRVGLLIVLVWATGNSLTPPPEELTRFEFTSGSEEWRASSFGGAAGGSAPSFEGASSDLWTNTNDGILVIDAARVRDGRAAIIDSPRGAVIPIRDDVFAVLRIRTSLSTTSGSDSCTGALLWTTRASGDTTSTSIDNEGDIAAAAAWAKAPGRIFTIRSDSRWHVYAIPLSPSNLRAPEPMAPVNASDAILTQLRFIPCVNNFPQVLSDNFETSFRGSVLSGISLTSPGVRVELDWLRIVRAPTLRRVEGCGLITTKNVLETSLPSLKFRQSHRNPNIALNRYFNNATFAIKNINASYDSALAWSSTYNCARQGGERITLYGDNFGTALPYITVGGSQCADVRIVESNIAVSCIIPSGIGIGLEVSIMSGDIPPLSDTKPLLSYAQPPSPVMAPPMV